MWKSELLFLLKSLRTQLPTIRHHYVDWYSTMPQFVNRPFTTDLPNFYQTFTKLLRSFYEDFLPREILSTRKIFLGVFQALDFFR